MGEPDPELVVRGRKGDLAALDQLIERHHGAVYRLALGIVRDPGLAEDVTQDALIKALRGLDAFRGDASFRTWLLTITRNEARGRLRRSAREAERSIEEAGELPAPGPDPSARAVERDEARRVREWIERLPEKQRLAVVLRIDEGMSFREVGEVIGSSEGAARVNYHHGIRRLREMAGRTREMEERK